MDTTSPRRLLVMGCSRSGTTLLQGLLASHSRIHTFPETGVFLKALGMRGRVLPWVHFGLTIGKERKALAKLLKTQTHARGPLPDLPPKTLSLKRSLDGVARFMDDLAAAHGRNLWLEKTPRHVLHAARIGRHVPGVFCIHMLRSGPDVVASIVDRARRFPDHFPRQSDPSYGIRQWNRSLRATREALDHQGHAIVFYDALVSDVSGTLKALCRGLGLSFEDGMATPADRTEFTSVEEVWKGGTEGPVKEAQSKFEGLFDEATRSQIRRRLEEGIFRELADQASGRPGNVLFSGS